MRYTMDEVATFLAEPAQYQDHYTDELLSELIAALYDDDVGTLVRELLKELPQGTNLRIAIAVVHLSANADGKGDLGQLVDNIQLAQIDYRDLLMAYYE